MKVFVFTLAFLGILASATCDVCYGDLGCFDDSLRCHRRTPDKPEDVGTTFTLFTRENRILGQVLDRQDSDTITSSTFSAARDTKFLVHGWTDDMGDERWPKMRDALLDNYDVNVVMVDWQQGAGKLYGQSKANTRVVGREIAETIKAFKLNTGASFLSMHVIGHSLGAHIGGYAGEALLGSLGRVSGMDPAGPEYTGDLDNACRLDRTDAVFVDAMHTDGEPLVGGGAGLMDELGHHDFYPNGGQEMPGCPPLFASCDHGRAVDYYIESISPSCSFSSTMWAKDWNDMETGNVELCWSGNCPEMGYHADASKGTGVYYLETNRAEPYCQG